MKPSNLLINTLTAFATLILIANYKIGVPHWIIGVAILAVALALPLAVRNDIRRRTGR